jgi:hypothetical protein
VPVVVCLLLAGLVFAGVLLSTPPGLVSLPDLVLGPARGARGAAEAYAVGAAASLALAVLVVSGAVVAFSKLVRRRRGS